MLEIKKKYFIDLNLVDPNGNRIGLIVEEVELNGEFGYLVIATRNERPYGPGQKHRLFKDRKTRDFMLAKRIKNSHKRFLRNIRNG